MTNLRCTAHKTQYGVELRCIRPHKHKGRHRWAQDHGFYPFGRLDPDNKFDQMLVDAFNRAPRVRARSARIDGGDHD